MCRGCKIGPTIYLPCPESQKSVTVCRCHYKDSNFRSEHSSPLSLGTAEGIKLSIIVCSCVSVLFDIFDTMPFLHSGSQTPGLVTVTVITDSGQDLGFTVFEYVDDMEDLLKQLVKDRLLQARYFAMLSTEFAFGNVTSGSNISQVQGLENVTDHGKTTR